MYILVIGPYDSLFVGPFRDSMSAQLFRHDQAIVKPWFDFYIYGLSEYQQNLRDFGPISTVAPFEFITDTAEERSIQ